MGSYEQLSSIQRRWYRVSFSYRRMEEKDVIQDRTLFILISFPTKEWRSRLSLRTGPCWLWIALEFISYKRMVEKDVTLDRPLCYCFLRKNGGKGCHTGQDLGIVYGRGTTLVKGLCC